VRRLLAWWRRRRQPPTVRFEECECGALVAGDDLHLVVAVQDDDLLAAEGMSIVGGGTAMSAAFCAEHCPGGCRNPAHA
jgi:hypothetical protein